MRMPSIRGVLYAEDFDAPEQPAASAPALPEAQPPVIVERIVIEPTFSLADLKRAAERAQEEGRLSARRESELETGMRRAAALGRFNEALDEARGALDAVAAQAAAATARTLLAMVAALLPDFARSRGRGEAAALLHQLLPAMAHEPHLVIRLHSSLLDDLREELAPVLRDRGVGAEWSASETMQPGDVVVRWQNGAAVRDTGDLHARIMALLMPGAETAPAPGSGSRLEAVGTENEDGE